MLDLDFSEDTPTSSCACVCVCVWSRVRKRRVCSQKMTRFEERVWEYLVMLELGWGEVHKDTAGVGWICKNIPVWGVVCVCVWRMDTISPSWCFSVHVVFMHLWLLTSVWTFDWVRHKRLRSHTNAHIPLECECVSDYIFPSFPHWQMSLMHVCWKRRNTSSELFWLLKVKYIHCMDVYILIIWINPPSVHPSS